MRGQQRIASLSRITEEPAEITIGSFEQLDLESSLESMLARSNDQNPYRPMALPY